MKLDPITEYILNEIEKGTIRTFLGPLGFLGIWPIYRSIRALASEKSRRCGAFAIGYERYICLSKVKIEENKKLIEFIKNTMKKCSETKNEKKCQKEGLKAIKKLENNIKKHEDKIKKFSEKGYKEKIRTKTGIERASDKKSKWY